ncbi:Ig-like domain-containing protein [Escherichia coli]|uniref:Ig-like domain-containing protein n=1 Tax=Escherichia coli TaxID=562 RepID=UPI0014857D32|nr:Ig-like domain-containing protein [Escherichia coli]QJS75146.1 hypothetical protein HHJ44_20010 [Escherichia coli]
MTRTRENLSGVGRPYLQRKALEIVSVTGLTVAPASASVKVGATTTDLYSKTRDGASDKAISVHLSDPQTATVTPERACSHGERREAGSVSIVGTDRDGAPGLWLW